MILERLALSTSARSAGFLLGPRVGATLWARPAPPSEAEIVDGLAAKVDHWDRQGFGLWLLRDRENGALLGRGGLQYTYTAGLPHDVEAAWAIVPDRWGQGLATELAFACVDVGFGRSGCARSSQHLHSRTTSPSRRVMEKAGFWPERDIVHAGLPHVLYRAGAPGLIAGRRAGVAGRRPWVVGGGGRGSPASAGTCVTGQLTRSAAALARGACGACLPGQGWSGRRALARCAGRCRPRREGRSAVCPT